MQRRLEMNLTQAEAARRAGRSLDTWRKWEADPSSVGEESRRRCSAVLRLEVHEVPVGSDVGDLYVRTWGECPFMTPRQAYAISVQLDVWNDIEISEWVQSPDEPLYTVGPFESFDLPVMMLVGENRAWAAGVAQRCAVIAREIESGVLPCDRPGPYIDEVLFGAASNAARGWAEIDPSLVEPVPAREETRGDAGDDEYRVGDDYWGELYDEFDDRSRWTDYDYPLLKDNPALRHLLDERPPLTWLDPPFDPDPDLRALLSMMPGVEG
ncbi:hypothetical protein DEO23_15605 [Brachybacterium endophyticum]|uniref:Uncharacterized protein n=2 Tax=Brachybacterium endophyticum TaxID=2182385 RepID=A0A2U2RGG5_9MICO|nr:hypothetical protein DEO23_15605 [Brachybacterium endophyticum]